MRFAVVFLALSSACGGKDKPTRKDGGAGAQNLLMISIDSLRKDRLSRYDAEGRDLTPFLSELMAESQVADRALGCSIWTYHAMPCALSGQYTIDRGMLAFPQGPDMAPWPEGSRFLADDLNDAGFHTILSAGNYWLSDLFRLTDGYKERFVEDHGAGEIVYREGVTRLENWHAEHPEQRWFLHLHLMEPHAAYAPPEAYREGLDQLPPVGFDLDKYGAHYAAAKDAWPSMTPEEKANLEEHLYIRYNGELRWLDDQLRTYWADLDDRGLLEDTLVVVYSDHGEQFYERGHQTHLYTMTFEENDILWFQWAKNLDPMVVDAPANQIDIVPSLLDGLGLPIPEDLPGFPMSEIPQERALYAEAFGRDGLVNMVQRGDQQLIHYWDGRAHYYDRAVDPTQQDDQFDPELPVVKELWSLLEPRVEISRGIQDDEPYTPPAGL